MGRVLYLRNRRGSNGMPVLAITVRIMKHVINPGDKYGRLTVIAEAQKAAADGKRYRAALCRCDCGQETTPRISSLKSGDAQSCGCSRGQPKYQQKRCPVCGTLTMIRHDHRSCSRACGYELARAARQAPNRPTTYGTAALTKPGGRPAATPALTAVTPPGTGRWSIRPAMTSGPDSSRGAADATATTTAPSARVTHGPS